MARPAEFRELVEALREEHTKVRETLRRLGVALERKRYAEAARLVPDLCDDLRQHIIDEEARVLKVLIDAHGRAGAADAIAVFQQHRAIHGLIGEMEKLAATAPGTLAGKRDELAALLEAHISAEEETVFPQALKAYRARPR